MTRDHALDGLRGLAALSVVLSHVAALTWVPFIDGRPAPDIFRYGMWYLGAPAVDLFFVLSGYVVARSLLRRRTGYVPFVLSRAIRLLPVAWLGVLAGLVLRQHIGVPPPGMSRAIERLSQPLTFGDMVGFITMTAPIPAADLLNPSLWTMFVEMHAGFAMPLIALCAQRAPVAFGIAGFAGCIILAFVVTGSPYALYIGAFCLGAAYAAGRAEVPRIPVPVALLGASLVLLLVRHWVGSDADTWRPVSTLGALGVIIAVEQGAGRRLLTSPPVHWLGAISYPLYTLHYPVLVAGALLAGHRMGITASGIAAIPVALLLATIAWILADRPSIALSRAVRGRASAPPSMAA
ncbi:acyltransferase [Roseomonas sp. NAR14]|uniref:Acyltransferase n=1 Tax=Roseomonas acroporae TaxID=2937791 RepID=A0A9X1YDY5_9PROT|nr:acyltransferase [Roseomonas acroporae]MCK8788032.1 acyltransferase [Roseomonas acroporae]